MSVLPSGWGETEIGSVCELINGRAFKPSDWSQSGLPIVRIQNLNNPEAEFNYCNFRVDERFYIESGELLFAWSGTPGTSFGAHVWRGGPAVLNQHIFRVLFNQEAFERDFLSHAINFKLDELIGKAHGGVGLGHVTKGRFENTRILLPPLAEQRRIVAKLDALDASAKRARADLDRIPTLVARAKQAILTKAFQGELTADFRLRQGRQAPQTRDEVAKEIENTRRQAWRSWLEEQGSNRSYSAADAHDWTPQYTLPSGWHWFSVDELCAASQYGSSAKTDDNRAGVPVLRMGNIQDGVLQFANLKFLPREHQEFPSLLLKHGDLLFNRTNSAELVGKSAVFEGYPYPCSFASYLIRLRPAAYSSKLLAAYINSALGRAWIKAVVNQQVGQANVNGTKLGRLGVPYMPEAEQAEIVRRIETAFAKIDRIAAEAASARALLERLDQAILAKAFRGELVPQDPSDEPAEKLLEKIRAARATPPARKTRKKSS